MDKITLNGVTVFPFSSANELLDYIENFKGILIAVNAEKILNMTDELREIINANIGYCDGSAIVLAVRQMGVNECRRIAGCDLWLHIIERYKEKKSFYLIGSKTEIISATVEKLKREYPYIRIVGYRNGYFANETEQTALIDDIAEKKPDVVFVAMGTPRQEFFMREMLKRHKALYQGLGGSFDVYSGTVKRAPKWWIDHNIEFIYRLWQQPKRFNREIKKVRFAYWLAIHKFQHSAKQTSSCKK